MLEDKESRPGPVSFRLVPRLAMWRRADQPYKAETTGFSTFSGLDVNALLILLFPISFFPCSCRLPNIARAFPSSHYRPYLIMAFRSYACGKILQFWSRFPNNLVRPQSRLLVLVPAVSNHQDGHSLTSAKYAPFTGAWILIIRCL